MSSTGVCDWIPGLPSFHQSVSQPTQPLPPGCLQISPVWVESLSKKGLQELLPLEAEGACLVARGESPLPPDCLGVFTCTKIRGTGRKPPVTRQQCWTPSHHGFLLGRGLRPRGPRRAQLMRNTHAGSLRVGSAHHSSWPVLTWLGQGPHDASAPQHRNPSPRSDGDLQPRRLCKEQEKMTPPLTLPFWKDPGATTVSGAALHGLMVGPHQEGNCRQATEHAQ